MKKKNQITDFFANKRLFLVTRENRAFNIKVRSLSKAQINYVVKALYGFHISCKFTASRHKTLPQALQDHYKKGIYALPGLSFNPNALKVRKTAQFQLSNFFRDKKRLVVWHDVVNNSLSRHRSNNNKSLTPSQLIEVLEKYQECIEAIVYCPREGTPDIYNQLKRSTLVTIHLVKDIVS